MPRIIALLVAAALVAPPAPAQHRVTTPRQALGFDVGADYHLATYTQLEAYWRTLARESPRLALREIGKSAEGRPQLMAIITAPENHKRLAHYQDIARRLALAQGLTDDQAHALAREGKAVVWIDGGLHATEVLGAHQLLELVYQMVSRDDPETRRILDDVILLAVQANPDGMELVSSWYMRDPDSLKRSTAGIPRLYQKYIGHDNNRDFYMVSQPETENMARVMFREWFPQIVYNHHQTGPAGAVLFAPPFRDPFNYYFDPLVPIGNDIVAAAMHDRSSWRASRAPRCAPARPTRRGGTAGFAPPPISTTSSDSSRSRSATRRRSTSRSSPTASCPTATCPHPSSRNGGPSGSRSSTRSPPTGPSSTTPRATARRCSTTSTAWGRMRSSAAARTTGRCTPSSSRP